MALTPDESVEQQRRVLDKYKNVSAGDASRRRAEDSEMLDNVTSSTYDAVQRGNTSGISSGLAKYAGERAKTTVAQNARADSQNLREANFREGVIAQRQQAALQNQASGLNEREATLKRAISQRAFDMGISSKELSLHSDSTIADIGFEQLKKDYDEGRVTAAELRNLNKQLVLKAQRKKQDAEAFLAKMKKENEVDIAQGNIEKAKQRLTIYYSMQREAAQAAAAAANNAAIVSGVFGIAGTVVGGIYGGPAGAAAGGAVGSAVGGAVARS